jgi:glycerophosphoryl diester phosphodiesterase
MHRALLGAALAVLATAVAVPGAAAESRSAASADSGRAATFDLQGHRGTRGLRPENTLAAFGKALQVGVTTLELDTGISQDGVVIVSHERIASSLECRDTAPAFPGDPEFPYIGKAWKDLTVGQIKTLDCGTRNPPNPATDPFVGTQEAVPGTRMPTLAEVIALTERYGADTIALNIETKLDPTRPDETVDYQTFARRLVETLQEHKVVWRSTLQSFDWRTLVEAKRLLPNLHTVALAQNATIFPGTPWTAGVTFSTPNPMTGEVAHAAESIGASILSPNYLNMPDSLIAEAHALGMPIIPWTINDTASMAEAIDRGVDGIITDYPDRLRTVMAQKGLKLPKPIASPFDVQGHRGARSYRPENTIQAFQYALAKGVDTLELDTGVTSDGHLIVLHDRRINAVHCSGGFSGVLVKDLTLAQIRSLDCGNLDPGFPDQVDVTPGPDPIPTLDEVLELAQAAPYPVRLNIETKISPLVDDTVPYDVFTRKLVDAIEDAKLEKRATIQSFDWRTIILARELNKRIKTVALVWQFAGADCDALDDECSLEAVMGNPAVKSPWTAGLDWWAFRDVGKLVRAAGAAVVSSNWQVHDPNQGTVASSDWYLKEDPAIFHGPVVAELQKRGTMVIPYTVNYEEIMQRVIDLGVDGLISDDVDLLQLVAKRNGLE